MHITVTRRLTSVVLMASVFASFAPPAIGAQPTVEPVTATRIVELPDAGVAITFPAAWRIWPSSDEITRRFSATNVAKGQFCSVGWRDGKTPEESVAQYAEGQEPVVGVEVIERPVRQMLPAGEGFHVAWRFEAIGDAPPSDVQHEYFVPAGDGTLSLRCHGDETGLDRFVGIVESTAPLESTPPASAPFDPRMEVPHRRIALSMPQEWSVLAWEETAVLGVPAMFGDVIVFQASLFDRDRDDEPRCRVEEGSDATADAMTAVDWRVELSDLAAQAQVAALLVVDEALPAGPAIRIDIDADPRLFGASNTITWLVPDGDRLVSLTCFSSDPPADGWRSIAETLELLPKSP